MTSIKNPFIILTSMENKKVRVNILHIITYASRNYSNSMDTYTKMTNASPQMIETAFKETVEEIDRMIAEYYNQ